MKFSNFKLLSIIFLLLFLTGTSCQKDEIEYADESIVIRVPVPGLNVYKTKNNYIDFVDIQITDDGELNAIPTYNIDDSRILVDKDGKIKQNFRWRLKSGYIIDYGASVREVFTDISIEEYVKYNAENGITHWHDHLIRPRIIDTDPFTEFYHLDRAGHLEYYTVGEINEMFENGSFKTIFEKLK